MGIFSSETVYQGAVAAAPLIEEKNRYSAVKNMLLTAIHQNLDIPTAIQIGHAASLATTVKQYVKYASTDYIYGLPSDSLTEQDINYTALRDWLSQYVTGTFHILNARLDTIRDNKFLMAWWLFKNYHTVINSPDPQDAQWHEGLDTIWIPASPGISRPLGMRVPNVPVVGLDGHLGFNYDYDPNPPLVNDQPILKMFYSIADEASWKLKNGMMYEVRYSQPSGQYAHMVRYAAYRVGDGDADLDDTHSDRKLGNRFLPMAILLKDLVRIDANKSDPWYITTKKLLKKVNLKLTDEMLDDLLDILDPKTHSKVKVYDMAIMFGAPINTHEKATAMYLWEMFLQWRRNMHGVNMFRSGLALAQQVYNGPKLDAITDPHLEKAAKYADSIGITLKDGAGSFYAVQEGGKTGFTINNYNRFIEHAEFSGKVQATNTWKVERVAAGSDPGPKYIASMMRIVWNQYTSASSADLDVGDVAWVLDKYAGHANSSRYRSQGMLVITHQVTDTVYKRMIVYQLQQAHWIKGKGPDEYIVLDPNTYEDRDSFAFPIQISILNRLPFPKRDALLQDSLRGIWYMASKQKVKWYQKAFFKFLMIVVSIVVILYAPVIAQMLGQLFSLSATFIANLALTLKGLGFSLLGSGIGGTVGQIIAMVGMVLNMGAGAYMSQTFAVFKEFTLANAASFLKAVSNIGSLGYEYYLKNEFKDMQQSMKEWLQTEQEKQEEFERMYMSGNISIYDVDLGREFFNTFDGSPQAFYERVLNPNPGALAIEASNDFPEMCLRLPKNVGDENIVDQQYEVMFESK